MVAQLGLTFVLALSAGLVWQGMNRVSDVDWGWDPDRVAAIRVRLADANYPAEADRQVYRASLLDQTLRIPGVTAAGWTGSVTELVGVTDPPSGPLRGYAADGVRSSRIERVVVEGDWFDAVGLEVTTGTSFRDDPGTSGVLISQVVADSLWPGAAAVGRTLNLSEEGPSFEVLGVVEDLLALSGGRSGFSLSPRPNVYFTSETAIARTMTLEVGSADPQRLLPVLRMAAQEIDPVQAVTQLETGLERVRSPLAPMTMASALFGVFALAGGFLALVGLYGLMAHTVVQRTREIALRIALGAEVREIGRLVLGGGVLLGAWGVALGVVMSYLALPALRFVMIDTPVSSTGAYLITGTALLVLAAASGILPIRRAIRISPNAALREC